jgi:hypothetical protein
MNRKGAEKPRPAHWLRRLGWLLALWMLGVATVTAVAALLRVLMRLAGFGS